MFPQHSLVCLARTSELFMMQNITEICTSVQVCFGASVDLRVLMGTFPPKGIPNALPTTGKVVYLKI